MTPDKAKAAARAALAKLRASDPLLAFKPSVNQEAFLKSKALFRLIIGGNRSGKTTTALADLAMRARGIHPHHKWFGPIRVFCFTVGRSQAATVTGRKLFEKSEFPGEIGQFPMIPASEMDGPVGSVTYGGTSIPLFAKLKNGSEFHFGWAGQAEAAKRFQGGQWDYVHFDESSCEGQLLVEAHARTMDARADASRPGAGGIVWSATGTEADANFERFHRSCEDKDEGHALFRIGRDENPAISKKVRDQFASVLTAAESRIRNDGTATAASELAIYGRQWSDARHMRASDYVPKATDNLWACYDPGGAGSSGHNTGILLCAVGATNPRKLRHWAFILQTRLTLDDEVDMLREKLKGRPLECFVYDIAAHKTEKSGLSVKNQLREKMEAAGIVIHQGMVAGRNRHIDGIKIVREYLDPAPWQRSVEPLIEFSPSDDSGGQIIRAQMRSYRSHEAGKFQGAGGVVKKDDEAPDCVRYLCTVRPMYNPEHPCGFPRSANGSEEDHIVSVMRARSAAIAARSGAGKNRALTVSLW